MLTSKSYSVILKLIVIVLINIEFHEQDTSFDYVWEICCNPENLKYVLDTLCELAFRW